MFSTLYFFEKVLAIGGIVMFFALLAMLVHNVIRQRPYALLLGAFIFPIVMVGFPSVKAVDFKNGTVALERWIENVENDPLNKSLGDGPNASEVRAIAERAEETGDTETQQLLKRAEVVKQVAQLGQEALKPNANPAILNAQLKKIETRPEAKRVAPKVRAQITKRAVENLEKHTAIAERTLVKTGAPPEKETEKHIEKSLEIVEEDPSFKNDIGIKKSVNRASSIRELSAIAEKANAGSKPDTAPSDPTPAPSRQPEFVNRNPALMSQLFALQKQPKSGDVDKKAFIAVRKKLEQQPAYRLTDKP